MGDAEAARVVHGVRLPDQDAETTRYAIKIPWLMGIIATRSVDTPVIGIKELKTEHEARIRNGMKAYAALQRFKSGDKSPEAKAEFDRTKADLGYGLLLKKYTPNVVDATPEHIRAAIEDTIPNVAPMFWSFRIMVGLGCLVPVRVRGGVRHPRQAASRAQPLAHAGSRCGAFRCRGSRWSWAGSSPSTAGSRGRSARCCRRTCRRLIGDGGPDLVQPRRLHRVLHGAAGRRALPDVQVRAARTRRASAPAGITTKRSPA